jgi:hypothetical protein
MSHLKSSHLPASKVDRSGDLRHGPQAGFHQSNNHRLVVNGFQKTVAELVVNRVEQANDFLG